MSAARGRRSRRHGGGGHSEGGSERWLVSYADFITLLFAFFVVMYAISQSDLKKFKQVSESVRRAFSGKTPAGAEGGSSGMESGEGAFPGDSGQEGSPMRFPAPGALEAGVTSQPDPEIQQIRKLLEEAIHFEESIRPAAELSVRGSGDQSLIRWVLQDSYPVRGVEVAQDYWPLLARVARVLQRFPDRPIRLEGHADAGELAASGAREGGKLEWQLGFDRAWWLSQFFDSRGVGASRMEVASRGAQVGVAGARGSGEVTRWSRARNRRVELLILPRPSRKTGQQSQKVTPKK